MYAHHITAASVPLVIVAVAEDGLPGHSTRHRTGWSTGTHAVLRLPQVHAIPYRGLRVCHAEDYDDDEKTGEEQEMMMMITCSRQVFGDA